MDHAAGAYYSAFSTPETALLLVSTKNRDLWPGPVVAILMASGDENDYSDIHQRQNHIHFIQGKTY